MDTATPLFIKLQREIEDIAGIKGPAVVKSQQIAGTLSQRQEPSLPDRVSKDKEDAEVQKNLESAKAQQPTLEDASKTAEMDDKVVDKYLSEILGKFLGSLK